MRKQTFLLGTVAMALSAGAAQAEIVGETVTYDLNGQTFEGYFARNTALEGAPLVLIVHDWDGLTDYERRRAQMLAERGYNAFAVDLYGQGVRPTTTDDKRAESGKLYQDREAMRARLQAGLEQARSLAGEGRVAAIGYCFGGAAVLEMARSGADLDGYVSFHGGLGTPEGQDYGQTQGTLLVLHGSADPVSGMQDVAALASELTETGVDFDMEIYGGARHSFTVWGSDDYDPKADLQSWNEMLTFFEEEL